MVLELKLRKVGNSVGLVLPKDALNHLDAREGDTICVSAAPDRTLRLTPSDQAFAKQMANAEDLIKRYRNALKELAK
jgi:putative addiction module antidote